MRINRHFRCMSRVCLVAILLVVIGGCSGNKRQVIDGTVTQDGRPLGPCIVRFHGANGYLTTALLQEGGKFTMTDVIPGEYKVTIKIDEDIGEPGTPEPGSGGKRKQSKPTNKGVPSRIPAKYFDPTTTDLVYTITPETTQIDIQLK